MAFLRNLAMHMIGAGPDTDLSLLEDLLTEAIKATYARLLPTVKGIPVFSDLKQQLERWTDPQKLERIEDLARLAAIKLRSWCGNGLYAKLFDRPTNLQLQDDAVYFNIARIKDDPKLEAATSYLIAHLMYSRSSEQSSRPKIILFDEAWSMLESPVLGPAIVQMFRAGRSRYVSAWAISQGPTDFTGTKDKPRPFGAGIVDNTYIKIFGKQRADFERAIAAERPDPQNDTAPGTAPILKAAGSASAVRQQAHLQMMIAQLMRLKAMEIASRNVRNKRLAKNKNDVLQLLKDLLERSAREAGGGRP